MGKPTRIDDVDEATLDIQDEIVDLHKGQTVAFDLDAPDSSESTEEPFLIKLDGHVLELRNPLDLDWQEWEAALKTNSTYQILGAAMSVEDAEIFFASPTNKLGRVQAMFSAWAEHYDIAELRGGNVAANRAERRAERRKTAKAARR